MPSWILHGAKANRSLQDGPRRIAVFAGKESSHPKQNSRWQWQYQGLVPGGSTRNAGPPMNSERGADADLAKALRLQQLRQRTELLEPTESARSWESSVPDTVYLRNYVKSRL